MFEQNLPSALKLHGYLRDHHWDRGLTGPDPGIRWNYRIGRFVKSVLRQFPWRDDLYYVQGQGYWALANWQLWDYTGDQSYRDLSLQTCEQIVSRQRSDGAWDYPNPEWRGRIATTEGNWGSLALLESYRRTQDHRFLDSALRWHRFFSEVTGYQRVGDELAINYFAKRGHARVCNNSVTTLRVLAEFADVLDDDTFREPFRGLVNFLRRAQKDSGEIPYLVPGEDGHGGNRPHFQCFQYNSFECLNLIRYYELTRDSEMLPMIARLLSFLRSGQAVDGHACYQCGHRDRQVTYHAAVMAAAFATAREVGMSGYDEAARRGYQYVISLQRANGSFPHSRREYYILRDQRSYPRYLAMILHHLLYLLAREPVNVQRPRAIAPAPDLEPAAHAPSRKTGKPGRRGHA